MNSLQRAKIEKILLENIRVRLPELVSLLAEAESEKIYVDLVYRFYHQSFKVYRIQDITARIVRILRDLAPVELLEKGEPFCEFFLAIITEGASGKVFEMEHNRDWLSHTRPMLEAYWHARYFLEQVVRIARELKSANALDIKNGKGRVRTVEIITSGLAAVLELYQIR